MAPCEGSFVRGILLTGVRDSMRQPWLARNGRGANTLAKPAREKEKERDRAKQLETCQGLDHGL